ncbi:MAG TPA: aminotransferase class V-fold PLP-dependent enzyme [Terriglobia bacterium]|nr:aminotransferase class V-fold PLP-dependent enzyme [Terriglobia bacterium]
MPDYRKEFFDFGPVTYLNCAYHAPFPRVTAERIEQGLELEKNPTKLLTSHFFDLRESNRARLARLTGAAPDEIALVGSATQGIGIVAGGLEFRPGDEAVISSANFPSNLFTWINLRRLGVKVHALKPGPGHLTVEDAAAVMNARTRVLALDWVSYTTGVKTDLAAFGELAHRHGAIFVVDGTQGVGANPMDLHALPVDALTAAAYKWLLAPYGTGFAYLRPELLGRLDLKAVPWLAVEGAEDFDALPEEEFTVTKTARRYDILAFLNMFGLDASLEFIERAGVSAIHQHCSRLLDRLREGLLNQDYTLAVNDPEQRSTILCFRDASFEATAALYRELQSRQISVSLRHDMIRVSPHLYNDEADIDRLLAAAHRR